MQLRNARLCLDCEEVHDLAQCPSCASETFAFITRWVPAPERRAAPRPVEPESPETLDTYRQMLDEEHKRAARWRMVKGSAVGLGLLGAAGWLWKKMNHLDDGDGGGSGPSDRDSSPPQAQRR